MSSAASLPYRTIVTAAEAESALKKSSGCSGDRCAHFEAAQGSLLAETEGLAFCDGEETVFRRRSGQRNAVQARQRAF